jgi:hypothetical protein
MESPGTDEETETNRDLLRSTVQKLPILRRKKPQNRKKGGHGEPRPWESMIRETEGGLKIVI